MKRQTEKVRHKKGVNMQKLHKPAENSTSTQIRQGKHKKPLSKVIFNPDQVLKVEIRPEVDITMKKAELVAIAENMEISTKGTKQQIIDRINNA